jgi:hypothetical protein
MEVLNMKSKKAEKVFSIGSYRVTEEELEKLFYGLFCTSDEDSEDLEEIIEWVDEKEVKGMFRAVKWVMRSGEQDFKIMIQEVACERLGKRGWQK